MKKIVSLLILSNLCFSFSYSQTIYVDASNNTGVEDGTEAHPFNTIKEGVAFANPGETVSVKQGTYYPDESWSGYTDVLFIKAGISLLGEGSVNTIIEGRIIDWDESNLSCTTENLSFIEYNFIRGTHEGPFSKPNIVRNCKAEYLNFGFASGIPVNDTTPGPNYGFLIESNDLDMDGEIYFAQGGGDSDIDIISNSAGWIALSSGGGYTYFIDDNDVQYGIIDNSGTNNTTISNNRIYNGGIKDRSGGNDYLVEDGFILNNTITINEDSPFLEEMDYWAALPLSCRSVTVTGNIITCTGKISGINSKSGGPFHITDNTIILSEVTEPDPDPNEVICGINSKAGWGYVTNNTIQGGQIGYYSAAGTEIFANNEITGSYIGFYSHGFEEVHHNTIKQCFGDGMVLSGLRGPIYDNNIKDNGGSGILVLNPFIDLGGGQDNCVGNNIIQGNGNYNLYVEATNDNYPVIYARYNVWDHTDPGDIMLYDIRDGNDSTGIATVDFTPFGYEGVSDNDFGQEYTIYPNPASDKISLQSAVSSQQSVMVEIYDLNGRKLLNKQIPAGSEEVTVDMSGLESGIYFCRLIMENKSVTKKLIIK